MLSRQKESNLQKLMRLEKITRIVILFLIAVSITQYVRVKINTSVLLSAFILIVLACISVFLQYLALKKVKKETNLEQQVKNMLQYKTIVHWAYIVAYSVVAIFIALFLYHYATYINIIIVVSAVLIGVIIDYFQFHYIGDRIKDFLQTNKELSELKRNEKRDR